MANDNRLLVRLEVTTSQLEKRMNRIVGLMSKQAGDVNNSWKRANKGIVKSAEDSANSIGREMDRLRAKYDPVFAASKRYEKALGDLNRAHKIGAIDTARYDAALDNLNAGFARSTVGVSGMGGATRGLGSVLNGAQHQIQNTAFQVADFAVQVGSGQRASTALAQQLPQLLGGFGALGAVMGAVVAIGVPLAAFFLSQGEAAEDLEKKLEALETAVSDYASAADNASISTAELEEKYGSASGAAVVFLDALRELSKGSSFEAVESSLDGIINKFGGLAVNQNDPSTGFGAYASNVQSKVFEIEHGLDIARDAAQQVYDALDQLGNAEGLSQQIVAGENLVAVLEDALGPFDELRGEAGQFVTEVVKAVERMAHMQGVVEDTSGSMQDIVSAIGSAVGGMDGLISSADTLAAKMFTAAGAAWDYAGAMGEANRLKILDIQTRGLVGGGRGGDPRQFGDGGSRNGRFVYTPPKRNKGGGGRSGGGRGKPEKPFFEDAKQQVLKMERVLEMIGKTDHQVAELTARYKMLDEAKKRGLDLDKKSADTGRTLRAEIDLQAQAMANLSAAVERQKEVTEFMESGIDSLSDALAGALLGTQSLGDAFKSVLQQMISDILSSNIKNLLTDMLTPSTGGGGGFLTKLLGGLLGSANGNVFSGGSHVQAYADGGVVNRPTVFPMNGGKTGLMGEAGPEAIMPLTRIGGKLGVQAELGQVEVRVFVDENGNWQAAVEGISGNVAAHVVQGNNRNVMQARRR